jgi:hypothetical protein
MAERSPPRRAFDELDEEYTIDAQDTDAAVAARAARLAHLLESNGEEAEPVASEDPFDELDPADRADAYSESIEDAAASAASAASDAAHEAERLHLYSELHSYLDELGSKGVDLPDDFARIQRQDAEDARNAQQQRTQRQAVQSEHTRNAAIIRDQARMLPPATSSAPTAASAPSAAAHTRPPRATLSESKEADAHAFAIVSSSAGGAVAPHTFSSTRGAPSSDTRLRPYDEEKTRSNLHADEDGEGGECANVDEDGDEPAVLPADQEFDEMKEMEKIASLDALLEAAEERVSRRGVRAPFIAHAYRS